MQTPIAYLNGQFVPASQAMLPVYDGGFVQGVTVVEQLRTFGGELFRLSDHLDRLWKSLAIVGIDPGYDRNSFQQTAVELAQRNHSLLSSGDDLGLCMFVTPGPYETFAATETRGSTALPRPIVCMHTFPVPFRLWSEKYQVGQALVISDVREVPGNCWPAELKCRSRIHYYLADRQARQVDPSARALLLDQEGCVAEASTASMLMFRREEGLVAPPADKILPGISIAFLKELAGRLQIPFSHRPIRPVEVARADEVMLCSTSPCLLPVTRLDDQPIADGVPGPVFSRLIAAWGAEVEVDILDQAKQFSQRRAVETD